MACSSIKVSPVHKVARKVREELKLIFWVCPSYFCWLPDFFQSLKNCTFGVKSLPALGKWHREGSGMVSQE